MIIYEPRLSYRLQFPVLPGIVFSVQLSIIYIPARILSLLPHGTHIPFKYIMNRNKYLTQSFRKNKPTSPSRLSASGLGLGRARRLYRLSRPPIILSCPGAIRRIIHARRMRLPVFRRPYLIHPWWRRNDRRIGSRRLLVMRWRGLARCLALGWRVSRTAANGGLVVGYLVVRLRRWRWVF
jgi:hypothetical protein